MKAKFEVTRNVTREMTAAAVGSGDLPVFATPMMIAMMEEAAMKAAAPLMEEGKTTVGVRMDAAHTAATPVGMQVWAAAELISQKGKLMEFRVTAWDEAGEIGSGTHTRAIVDAGRFLQKTQAKKDA